MHVRDTTTSGVNSISIWLVRVPRKHIPPIWYFCHPSLHPSHFSLQISQVTLAWRLISTHISLNPIRSVRQMAHHVSSCIFLPFNYGRLPAFSSTELRRSCCECKSIAGWDENEERQIPWCVLSEMAVEILKVVLSESMEMFNWVKSDEDKLFVDFF